jgi:hypothetical protein
MRPRFGTTVPSQRRATLRRPLLAPRPVFRILENRKVLEVACNAALEVVAVARPTFALAVDERQVATAAAPAAPAALRPLALEPPAQPRPFSADDESEGAGDQHDRNDGHSIILVRGRGPSQREDLCPTLKQALKVSDLFADRRVGMPRDNFPLAVMLFVLGWATVARAVLVFVQKLPPTCSRCGRRYERKHLGEPVCKCGA